MRQPLPSACPDKTGTNRKTKLSTRDLSKHYGAVTALESATLDLPEGEFLTLLGPSGSGKSTLLMLVAGLVPPTGGDIWIDGKLATYLPPNKRDIGVVFQNYALFPHLTVEENIAFPLRMRSVASSQIAAEVRHVLEAVQLPDVAARYPRELSGGQQQRIALARCMVYRPPVILMDEPLGALDRKLRDHMQMEIKDLHRRLGITVLYVTHDQEEAMAMSDRICLLNSGRIEQLGTPEDLYFHPRTLFAADFLGESNIFEAVLASAGGTPLLHTDGGLQVRACHAAIRPGERAKLIIRPESLRLLAPGDNADNEASGTVQESVFTGGVSRHYLKLANGPLLSVKQLTTGRGISLEPGSEVRVGWDAEQTVVLAPESCAA